MRRDEVERGFYFGIGVGIGFALTVLVGFMRELAIDQGRQEGIGMGYQKAMTEYNERLENKAWIHFDQAFARDVEEGTGEVRHATR